MFTDICARNHEGIGTCLLSSFMKKGSIVEIQYHDAIFGLFCCLFIFLYTTEEEHIIIILYKTSNPSSSIVRYSSNFYRKIKKNKNDHHTHSAFLIYTSIQTNALLMNY